MSNRNSSYETLYGVGLLDDLHNYFPALLYEEDSFRSVREVLHYISSQTRRRFDLYSFGLHAYESANDSAEESSSSAVNTVPRVNMNQFYRNAVRVNSNATPTQEVAPAVPPTPTTTTRPSSPTPRIAGRWIATREFDVADDDEGDAEAPAILNRTMLTTLLAGLQPTPLDISIRPFLNDRTGNLNTLSALANILLRSENINIPNLEPVIVRPTAEQIERATLLGNPLTEQDCTVCQDIITNEQQGRKIIHCGHWFHKDCIDPWFQQNVQCPVCRFDIREHRQSEQSEEIPVPNE